MGTGLNIVIVGSSASRDAFTEIANDHAILDFYARMSFGSAFRSRPFPFSVNELDPQSAISSAWQRRMMETDIERRLPGILTAQAEQTDMVLVDFIDERFQLVESDGEYATYSVSFQQCAKDRDFPIVKTGTDGHFALWVEGFTAFKLQMDRLGIPVILNKVWWGQRSAGEEHYAQSYVDRSNAYLRRLYRIAEAMECEVIDYGGRTFELDPNHKWGLAPFHYVMDIYAHAIKSIDEIAARQKAAAIRPKTAS